MPIVFKSTPASRNQNESVPKTNNNGKPEEKPKKNMRTAAGFK
jgi:hypothetical protein